MGGTFVDCVVRDGGQLAAMGKAPTTPSDPVAGILAALSAAAEDLGLGLDGLLAAATEVVHGTTAGLNALLTRTGSRGGAARDEGPRGRHPSSAASIRRSPDSGPTR